MARRTGVATSALRYWETQGLIPAPVGVSGQRRYTEATVDLVGMILLLRDVGRDSGMRYQTLRVRPHLT